MDDALRAADLLHDAHRARQASRFEQEYHCVKELIPLAAEVPAVTEYVIRVATRYRSRSMVARGDELLVALSNHEHPPLAALVALANARRQDGNMPEAVNLLSRALEQAPDANAVRLALLELLKQTQQHALIESHLQYILERNPNEPYMRLDLASALDRQGKTKEAKDQVERFRQLRLRDDQRKAWRYLRGLGLGKYIDEVPGPAPSSGS
jgi:tetratricopeptide (TPR) repeat protein